FILFSNHPIYCLFSLILTFINFSILLLFLGLEFLALSYIIVYVGAICVLFIFVILLLNIRVYNLASRENFWWLTTSLFLSGLLSAVYLNYRAVLIDVSRFPYIIASYQGDILLFGKSFFNYNWQYLLLTVLLLLLAVIATIAVSLKKSQNKNIKFSFFF
ncbi:NADH-quinone oxidoreductase subunit J, partial [bacterium]